ncbi:hypothetical protein [Brevibacillus fulvus]|uniref:Uncharacterized protein n=1 Tax=Brevibacillus fulvus TaxID=1125967 RepID=A0A938Y1H8_9BACL|nr:hypothetical protein [Brevibacillus fulvus]MBM7591590.1 hypothetical protein [Brevibacillus fulvus]
MKKSSEEVLYQAEATYKDLLLRKNLKLRIFETVVFVLGMLVASSILDADSDTFKLIAFAIAIAVVGLFPFLYKLVLQPKYTLTRTHLIVSMSGKETAFPLNEVEPVIEGRHIYRLSGKRESLMVSREFLGHLNERLRYFQNKAKRR